MADLQQTVAAALSGRLSRDARVALAETADFDKSNLRYTQYERPTYALAVVPACEQDVVETLKVAQEFDIPFAARSGHHAVTTSMRHLKDGILIDMRSFRNAELNEAKTEATVGGGILTDEFVAFLQDNALEVTVGSCPTTGLIGVAFGAGLGRLQGKYGYLHDNMLSCRLLLADGSIINVSKDSHPDLFWAIRGAGHNFGIALSVTFKVYPQANKGIHYSWDLIYTIEQCGEVMDLVNSVHADMPPELAMFVLYRRDAPNGLKGAILVNLVWSGAEAEGEPWIQKFADLECLSNSGKTTASWRELPWITYGGANSRLSRPEAWHLLPYKMMGAVSVETFDLKTTRAFFESIRAMNEQFDGKGWFGCMFECLPNHKTRELPSGETAFPWRWGSNHFLMMTATPKSLDDRADFEAHLDKWKQTFVEVSGYGRLQQYVNYGNTTSTSQDPPEALYGYEPWRLQALRELKKKYDPRNAFRWYQPFV